MFTLNQIIALIITAFCLGVFAGGIPAVCFTVHSLYRDGYLHLVPAPKA